MSRLEAALREIVFVLIVVAIGLLVVTTVVGASLDEPDANDSSGVCLGRGIECVLVPNDSGSEP